MDPTPPTVGEAELVDDGAGLEPSGDGWFIVNVADAAGWTNEEFGCGVAFESRDHPFPQFGVNIHVLEPGQVSCRYHYEPAQEDFLVLRGECVAVVEEQARPLRAGDLLHCPPMTRHVFVGAGSGPCAILMIGSRVPFEGGGYPPSEVAATYGAAVDTFTADPKVAYAECPQTRRERARLDWLFEDAR